MDTDPTQFDPDPAVEGPDNGLVEAVAERIWRQRKGLTLSGWAKARLDWEKDTSGPVKQQWRETAREVLKFLIDIGMRGPAGKPKGRFDRYTYGWVYNANEWALYDEDGKFVCLANDDTDLALMCAAPGMRRAILDLIEPLAGHPAMDEPLMKALADSLPE